MTSTSFRQPLTSALKIDSQERFDLPFLRRLLQAIDVRLKPLQEQQASVDKAIAGLNEVALDRINTTLTPAIEQVLLMSERGFLIAQSATEATLAVGDILTFTVADDTERELFTPSPFTALTREGSTDDYAVARTVAYDKVSGDYRCEVLSFVGNAGPHSDWVIGALAGSTAAQYALLEEGQTAREAAIEAAGVAIDNSELAQKWAESPEQPDGSDTMSAKTAARISIYSALDAKKSMEAAKGGAEEAKGYAESYNAQALADAVSATGADAAQTAADRAAARAAAEASGDVLFYNTKSEAGATLGGLPDGQIVEVFTDETQGSRRTRYRVETGALVFKLFVDQPELDESIAGLSRRVSPIDISYSSKRNLIDLPTDSIREHAVVWHPGNAKYYMVADVLAVGSTHHPNTYDSEIGLFSSTDLSTWTYHGICIEKGGVGEIGEFGVATPAGAAYLNGKIYCGFSARNTAGFTNRSIGLSWSGADPEVLPWTRAASAISDTSGEDDDPAVVAIGDTLHLYHRTSRSAKVSGYHIVHAQSKTPEDAASWSKPAACTINPNPGVRAMELTAAVYYGGLVHLFVMEQGDATGTSHLVSADPAGSDFAQADPNSRFLPSPGFTTAYNGHFSVVQDVSGEIVAYSWTVFAETYVDASTRYGVDMRPVRVAAGVGEWKGSNVGVYMSGDADNFFAVPHSTQLNFDGQFSLLFKARLGQQTTTASDNYHIFYKGADGGTPTQAGTVSITYRGSSSYNGLTARLTLADGTYFNLRAPTDISEKLFDQGDTLVALTRDADDLISLYAWYDDRLNLLATSTITPAQFTMAQPFDAAIGAAYSSAASGAVPFKGLLYEAAFYNIGLTEAQIADFSYRSVAPEHRYTPNGGGEFDGCRSHYIFDGARSSLVADVSGLGGTAKFMSSLPGSVDKEGVSLSKSTAQSIPDSAYTKVVFDTVTKEVGDLWDGATLRVTESGWYAISANLRFAANITGIRGMRLFRNAAILQTMANVEAVTVAGQVSIVTGSALVYLDANDTVSVHAFQSSGGALNLEAVSGAPSLSLVHLG